MSRSLFWMWVGAFVITVLSGPVDAEYNLFPIGLLFVMAASTERLEWEL